MKKTLLASLLIVTFWLIWFSSLRGVLCTDSSDGHTNILNVNSEWRLMIDGSVQNPLNLTFEKLVAMPRSTVPAVLVCPGLFSISGNWTGVRLGLVLEEAGFDPNATIVKFLAQDGYEVSLSIKDALREDVIIAYEKDGEPLPETTRLVIPGAAGVSWISNITCIALLAAIDGFSNIEMEPISTPWIVASIAVIVVAFAATTIYLIYRHKLSQHSLWATTNPTASGLKHRDRLQQTHFSM